MKKNEIQYHEDDRAQRLLDVFPDLQRSQINVSYIRTPGHVVAWHKHKYQTDNWVCLKGSLKVGLASMQDAYNNYVVTWEYLSEKRQQVLVIPPETYHGYMALEPNTILLYCTNQKYDPTDEYREDIGAFNEIWSIEEK